MKPVEQCPDCAPSAAHQDHTLERHLELLDWLSAPLSRPVTWLRNRAPRALETLFGHGLGRVIDGLRSGGMLGARRIDPADELAATNLRLSAAAAQARGATIHGLTFRGQYISVAELSYRTHRQYFEMLPIVTLATPKLEYDDKQSLKRLLAQLRLPYTRGQAAFGAAQARQLAYSLGGPVVIKPRFGSLSRHTFVNLRSPVEIAKAIERASRFSRHLMVEEYVAGHVWRVTFVGDRLVAACRRDSPSIMGDGVSTIGELLSAQEQTIHKRSGHKVALLSNETGSELARQGYTVKTVLGAGQRVQVQHKVIAALGADFHDVTDELHPQLAAELGRLVAACHAPILGIDLIAPRLDQPLATNGGIILEVNSLPTIELHHYPTTGQPRDVAGIILDAALAPWTTYT